MLKKIGIVLILAFIGYGLFTLGDVKGTASFKDELAHYDSLIQNDKDTIALMTAIQDSIKVRDSILTYQVEHQKTRVIKIKEIVEVEKNKIDNFSEQELVSYLNQRYPKDTITNPLPVAQPVLTFVAKDLAAYDGAKHEIVIKDSVIAIQESRITLKDSTIGLYANKEIRFKSIISNQDLKINQWSKQYDNLNLNYKKLQVKNKFQKIGSYIIIGGLAYTLLVK
jgi:fructose-1,6-bisphosphatase/inositol monophosphatase family enzyme